MNSKLKKKILYVGDSLGLPREGIKYEDTRFYRLKCTLSDYEFIPHFQRALTTAHLVGINHIDFLKTTILLGIQIINANR